MGKIRRFYKVHMRFCFGASVIFVAAAVFLVSANLIVPSYLSPMNGFTSVLYPKLSNHNIGATHNHNIGATHIRFLKVHKAASSTMQNLLFRFAIRHNLTVTLPKHGNYISNHKGMIKSTDHYDIFACHTLYSKKWFDVIPVPNDAVNIAIVRNPMSRMISAAYKYRDGGVGYLQKVPKSNYIHNLLQYPEKYDPMPFSHTRNRMGKDFGFSVVLTKNDREKMNDHLRLLEKEFTLILVVERFNESLVLLKRFLNWQLQDIVYMVAHSFEHEQVNLTESDIRQLKKLNFLDYAVYDHFGRLFNDIVENQTNDFWVEVEHFKDTIDSVTSFCNAGIDKPISFEASRWNDAFLFHKSECDLMLTKERQFLDYLREKQSALKHY